MENPVITELEAACVQVGKHTSQIMLQFGLDERFQQLVCHFLEEQTDLYAAVRAPLAERQQFARRIVSFISAYMRIADADLLEAEILRCLNLKSLSASSTASMML